MKLLFISPFPPLRGGISKETETIYDFLKNKHEIYIVSFKKLYPQFLFPGKTQFLENNTNKKFNNIISLLDSLNPFTWVKTCNYIRSKNIDSIIIRYWHPFFIPMYIYIMNSLKSSNHNIKFYCIADNISPHDKFPFSNFFLKKFFTYFYKCFVMSDNTLNQISSYIMREKVKKVFLPIKSNLGPLLDKYESRNLLDMKNEFTILFFGLIRNYKGLDVLLRAANELKNQNIQFRLLIVGECYEKENKYNRLISDFKLKMHIQWINEYVPDRDINLYFSASDLVVLPYKKASQSGIIPIAYNYNKIVLVSDINGLNEFVENEKTGYLFESSNYKNLSDKISQIYKEHDFNKSEKYINSYKNKFTIDKLCSDLLSFID